MTGTDGSPKTLLLVVNTDFFFLSHRLPIALAAKDRGWRVVVATADTGRAEEIRACGLEHVSLSMTRSDTNIIREAGTVLELVSLFRHLRPNVIHLVATKSVLYGGLASFAASTAGVVFAVTGVGYLFVGRRFPLLRRVARAVFRLVLRRRRAITIFQNVEDQAVFVDHGIVPGERAVLIRGSGVDVSTWPVYPEPDQPVVLLASRLFEEKGVRTFVEAARVLRREDPSVRFVLVGALDRGVPTAIREEELIAWVEEGVVEYWGHRTDMPEVLGKCSVFALPTYHAEGLPKVLLEAGAAERPAVTTDAAGCRDAVVDGETGLLVPPRDPGALALAIGTLLKDGEMRRKMGSAARDRVAMHFELSDVVHQTLDLYGRVDRPYSAPRGT